MRFLLTLALVAIATPAAAQITARQTGNLALVDDNGKLIGGLYDFFGSTARVTLSTPQSSAFLPVSLQGFTVPTIALGLYFESADCTGHRK